MVKQDSPMTCIFLSDPTPLFLLEFLRCPEYHSVATLMMIVIIMTMMMTMYYDLLLLLLLSLLLVLFYGGYIPGHYL